MTTTNYISPVYGGTGGRGFKFECPAGSQIANITTSGDKYVDSIRVKCAGGLLSPQIGVPSVKPQSWDSKYGFIGTGLTRSDVYLNNLQLLKNDGSLTTLAGGTGGKMNPSWRCPSGQTIYKIDGKAGSRIDSIKFYCRPSTGAATSTVPIKLISAVTPTTIGQEPSNIMKESAPTPIVPPRLLQPVDMKKNNKDYIIYIAEQKKRKEEEEKREKIMVFLFFFLILIAIVIGLYSYYNASKQVQTGGSNEGNIMPVAVEESL